MNGSGKGSLWSGALLSCIAKFDSSLDLSAARIQEFPSFAAIQIGGFAHVMVNSLESADLGQFLAFVYRSEAQALNLYLTPAALPGQLPVAFSDVSAILSLQGEGFEVPVRVFEAQRSELLESSAKSTLVAVVQDEDAKKEFMGHERAAELVDLVESSGCDALFVKDQMIATYLGLEVARSKWSDGRLALEVGVGRNDRMAKSWLEDSRSHLDQLQETISVVSRYRIGDSRFHPLARLSLARWMRLAIHGNPDLIGVSELTPIELIRKSGWPSGRLWSLRIAREPKSEEASMYEGFSPSFEEDSLSFALAADREGRQLAVAIASAIDLGVVAKLYEVTRSLAEQGIGVDGSILVLNERNRIVPIERLVDLAGFNIKTAALLPEWKTIGRG